MTEEKQIKGYLLSESDRRKLKRLLVPDMSGTTTPLNPPVAAYIGQITGSINAGSSAAPVMGSADIYKINQNSTSIANAYVDTNINKAVMNVNTSPVADKTFVSLIRDPFSGIYMIAGLASSFVIYTGTATADITTTDYTNFPNPQIAVDFPAALGGTHTIPVSNPLSLNIPDGMPCLVATSATSTNGLMLIAPSSVVLPGVLNSDCVPGGSALCTPQLWGGSSFGTYAAIGQVNATDFGNTGGRSGNNVFIMFVGSWLFFGGKMCA